MMDSANIKPDVEQVIFQLFNVHREEEIPTRPNPFIKEPPSSGGIL